MFITSSVEDFSLIPEEVGNVAINTDRVLFIEKNTTIFFDYNNNNKQVPVPSIKFGGVGLWYFPSETDRDIAYLHLLEALKSKTI